MIAPSVRASMVTTTVAANHGKACHVQLRLPEGATDLPLVFTQLGTGTYSMTDEENLMPNLDILFKAKRIAILTLDKPGISSENGKIKINDPIYNSYTQSDLVTCAQNAILWSLNQGGIKSDGKIFLDGHSEGAQVVVRTYARLLASYPAVSQQVTLLSLHGIPMESWKTILNQQLDLPTEKREDKDRFWRAFRLKDDLNLRKFGDLTFAYLDEILQTERLSETLKTLAKSSPKASIQFFQGLEDTQNPHQEVAKFESWNSNRLKQKEPVLNISARYYQAGHGLNRAAAFDMLSIYEDYLSQKRVGTLLDH